MRNEIESIVQQLDTRPDLPTELQDRKSARDRVAEFFKSHPGQEISQDDLAPLAGSAITQRVRECARDLHMNIRSVPKYLTDTEGRKHRLRNCYVFTEHRPLGRDAGEQIPQPRLWS